MPQLAVESEKLSPNDETHGTSNTDKMSIRKRLKHFTWAWFLSTMSTGGLAIAIAETPHRFRG
jgi:hypothetical protein